MKRLGRLVRKIIIGLPFFFCLCLATEAIACWGNRPLAMGGAFTGLADDINAVYWNPGGLGLNKGEGITHMSNLGSENSSNYDHYFAGSMNIVDKKRPKKNYGALGLAFVVNETIIDKKDYEAEYWRRNNKRQRLALSDESPFIDRDTYVQIGYGIKPIKREELAIGVNFKSVKSEIDDPVDNRDADWMDIDLGMIWQFGPYTGKSKLFSLGFLMQNVGEAKLIESDEGKTPEMIRNFRPGFSIKPDGQTILSLEIYDALGETEGNTNDASQNIRLGAERWLGDFCALRAGIYHLNNSSMLAYTGGVGIRLPKFWNLHTEFDATIMHWDKTGNNSGFGGLTVRF
jgi:hypothetical protein